MISKVVVSKLGLAFETQPKLYKIAWLSRGTYVTVSKRVMVSFSIGLTYCDDIHCDLVPMDACHLLLGRTWQYNCDVLHNGRTNTYSLLFRGKRIMLVPNKPRVVISTDDKIQTTLLSKVLF